MVERLVGQILDHQPPLLEAAIFGASMSLSVNRALYNGCPRLPISISERRESSALVARGAPPGPEAPPGDSRIWIVNGTFMTHDGDDRKSGIDISSFCNILALISWFPLFLGLVEKNYELAAYGSLGLLPTLFLFFFEKVTRGEVEVVHGRRARVYTRKEEPIRFWLVVSIAPLLTASILIFAGWNLS